MVDSDTLAGWTREFQQLHDTLMKGREQFEAWFEETAILEAEIKTETDEIRQCVADIKNDRQRYREIIAQLTTINVAEFSAEELEKRSGKVSKLLDLLARLR